MKGKRNAETGDITIEVSPEEILFEPFLIQDRNGDLVSSGHDIGTGIMHLAFNKGAEKAPAMFKSAEINSTKIGFHSEDNVFVVLFSRAVPGYDEKEEKS